MLQDKEILLQAHERYQLCYEAWADMQQRHTEILKFVAGEQWTEPARNNFENNGFTAHTENRLPTYLRQITNELRKNPPTIQIDAKEQGTVDTAEAVDDSLRNIQLDSRAEIAYIEGAESAATVGIGYIRVRSEYESNKSFNQKLVIEPVFDSNTVMLDPSHRGLAGEDSEYAFVTTALTHDEFKRRYPKSALAKKLNAKDWTAAHKAWIQKDTVMIAEYYFKDYAKKTLNQVQDQVTGEITYEYTDEIDQKLLKAGALVITDSRPVNVPTVRWTKLVDTDVLDASVWPGCYIPIVPVKGDEYWVDGKRKLVGAVEPAMDAQVMLNYNISLMAQMIQMAPKAPYIGTADQFKTYEQQWADINNSNQAFLPYNGDEKADGKPSRDLGEVPIQAMAALVAQAVEGLKSVFGVFDPDQQSAAPESGKAILARQHQSYNSNYHFYDNLARSIQHVGCVCLEAMPTFYDTPRTVQTMKKTGEKRNVDINTKNPKTGEIDHDYSKLDGNYGVAIQTGPSFGTKRETAVMAITSIMELNPTMAQNLADLAVMNMDIPGAKEAVARCRAMVDPAVLAASEPDQSGMEPEQVVTQLKQQVQALTAQNEAHQKAGEEMNMKLMTAEQELKLTKMGKLVEMHKADLDYKVKSRAQDIEEATTEVEIEIKQRELDLQEQQLNLKREELGLKAVGAMNSMDHAMLEVHERRQDRADRMAAPSVSIDEVGDPEGNDNEVGNTLDTSIGNDLGGKFG